jgi:hypothetical protein
MKSLIVMLMATQVLMTGYLLTSGEERSVTDNVTPYTIEGGVARSNYQPVDTEAIISRRVIF